MLANQVNRLQDSLSIWQQDLLMSRLSPVRGEHPLRLCRLSTIRQNRQLRNSRTNLETLRILRRGYLDQRLLVVMLLLLLLRLWT